MADINYTYTTSKHLINNYKNTVETYEWLKNCFEYVFSKVENLDIHASIEFSSGEISYKYATIEDLKKHAFSKDLKIVTFYIFVYDEDSKWDWLAYAYAKCDTKGELQQFSISAKSETVIADLTTAMNQEKKIIHTQPVTINQHVDNSIHIGDNANINNSNVGNNTTDSKICSSMEIKGVNNEKWYEKITWNVVAPVISGIILTIILIWLGLN